MDRSLHARVFVLVFVGFAFTALDSGRREAHATTSVPKPRPSKIDRAKSEVPSDCVRGAYAELAKEIPALRSRHAGDDAGFRAAYAKRKAELVGKAALRAKGCALPSPKS